MKEMTKCTQAKGLHTYTQRIRVEVRPDWDSRNGNVLPRSRTYVYEAGHMTELEVIADVQRRYPDFPALCEYELFPGKRRTVYNLRSNRY